MTIEIIARDTCPTCGGTGSVTTHPVNVSWLAKTEDCDICHGNGTVPRVLATFADAAALRKKINNSVGFSIGDLGSVSGTTVRTVRDAVLAELGIDDHPQPPALVD